MKKQHGGKREGAGRKPKPEGQKPKVTVTLERRALNNLDTVAELLKISRSEVVERYGQNYKLIETVLKAAQKAIEDCRVTESGSYKAFYEVDGDIIHELNDALVALLRSSYSKNLSTS